MQPVLQGLRAAQAGDDQVIEGVLTCQGQQGSAHSDTQEHEQAGEVLDPHLEGLRDTGGGVCFVFLSEATLLRLREAAAEGRSGDG